MPKKSQYTIADHKKAFDLFYELRAYQTVAKEMGIDTHTIRRWSTLEAKCSCPWHNWDALIEEKQAALNARLNLIEQGEYDPIAHEQALMNVDTRIEIPEKRKEQLRSSDKVMVRSELERMTQLEYLWSKLFYEATGIITDHSILVDSSGDTLSDKLKEEYFAKGLSARNLEGCVKCLKDIAGQIDDIKKALGIHKRTIATETENDPSGNGKVQLKSEEQKELTMDELRHLQQVLRNSDPEKMRAMVTALKADEEVNDTIKETMKFSEK